MKLNGRHHLLIVSLLIVFTILAYSTSAYSTTFKGKVVDADTREPIEGTVVVASWIGEQGGATGGTSRLEDVRETLTDRNGEWTIKGPRGTRSIFLQGVYRFFTFVVGGYYTLPPEFIVFKPGYCSYPKGFYIAACKDKIKPLSQHEIIERETIELPKLTHKEDRLKNIPGPAGGILEKQLELIKLINKERRDIGLKDIYKEIFQEMPK